MYCIYEWFKKDRRVCIFQKKKYVLVIYLFPVRLWSYLMIDTCNGNVNYNRLIDRQETDARLCMYS